MPEWVTYALIVTGLLAFIICVGGGLAILFELWTPRNAGTRKLLVNGVVISLVTAVGGFAAQQFTKGDNRPDAEVLGVVPKGGTAISVPVAKKQAPANAPVAPAEGGEPEVPPNPAPLSEAVAAWSKENLPPRPTLPQPDDAQYPSCAADLRAKDVPDIAPSEARTCYRALQAFNAGTLLTYQNAQIPYVERLDSWSTKMPEGELLNFIRQEYYSFTSPQGNDFGRFNRISNRFDKDMRFVARLQ